MKEEQSKIESAIESSINIITGFLVSLIVWICVVPAFWPELKSSYMMSIGITVLFTVTSWLRSYYWRRFFATDVHKKIHRWLVR